MKLSTSLIVALVSAGVEAVRVNSANQLESQFNFGSFLDKGAASLTKIAGGSPANIVQNLHSQVNNIQEAVKKGDVSDLISASGQVGGG